MCDFHFFAVFFSSFCLYNIWKWLAFLTKFQVLLHQQYKKKIFKQLQYTTGKISKWLHLFFSEILNLISIFIFPFILVDSSLTWTIALIITALWSFNYIWNYCICFGLTDCIKSEYRLSSSKHSSAEISKQFWQMNYTIKQWVSELVVNGCLLFSGCYASSSGIAEVLMCRHKARNALGHVFVAQVSGYLHRYVHTHIHITQTDTHCPLCADEGVGVHSVQWLSSACGYL